MARRRPNALRTGSRRSLDMDRQMLLLWAKEHRPDLIPYEKPGLWHTLDTLWLYQFRLEVVRFCAFWIIVAVGVGTGVYLKFGTLGPYWYLFPIWIILHLLMVKYCLALRIEDNV